MPVAHTAKQQKAELLTGSLPLPRNTQPAATFHSRSYTLPFTFGFQLVAHRLLPLFEYIVGTVEKCHSVFNFHDYVLHSLCAPFCRQHRPQFAWNPFCSHVLLRFCASWLTAQSVMGHRNLARVLVDNCFATTRPLWDGHWTNVTERCEPLVYSVVGAKRDENSFRREYPLHKSRFRPYPEPS
jgi:hypothetical protein